MKIRHLVCLLPLIISLLVASEAFAGGWWLWVRDESFGYPKGDEPRSRSETDWSVIADFPTEMACRQRIKERIQSPTSLDNFSKEHGFQMMYKVTEDTINLSFFEKDAKPNESNKMRRKQIIYHICLPESTDPRKNSQRK